MKCTSIREHSNAASCANAGISRFPNRRAGRSDTMSSAEQPAATCIAEQISHTSDEEQPTDQGLQSLLVALDLDEETQIPNWGYAGMMF